MKKFLFTFIAGAALLGTAQAQNQFQDMLRSARPYIGAGANFADHEYKLPGATRVDGDGWNAGWKIYGGADFDPMWGVEIGYTDFSKSDFNYTQGGLPGRGRVDGYGAYLAGKGRFPLPAYPQAELFGKLGVAYSHRKLESNLPLTAARNNDDTGLYAGVGAQWKFNDQWAVVGEYERYGRSKRIGSSADVLSVSLRFNF